MAINIGTNINFPKRYFRNPGRDVSRMVRFKSRFLQTYQTLSFILCWLNVQWRCVNVSWTLYVWFCIIILASVSYSVKMVVIPLTICTFAPTITVVYEVFPDEECINSWGFLLSSQKDLTMVLLMMIVWLFVCTYTFVPDLFMLWQ